MRNVLFFKIKLKLALSFDLGELVTSLLSVLIAPLFPPILSHMSPSPSWSAAMAHVAPSPPSPAGP